MTIIIIAVVVVVSSSNMKMWVLGFCTDVVLTLNVCLTFAVPVIKLFKEFDGNLDFSQTISAGGS